ncbi:MAG: hypothetical protein MPI95_04155 [Nitrosopumilus sp.]|nr:hypothetical protein [Nitrosopumilus sp.]MDA7958270.1 hypothetical protein [Nitrosopumilus sp.]
MMPDVHAWNTAAGLSEMGRDAATMTEEPGFENRGDDKIPDHARRNGPAAVTDDKRPVKRPQEAGMPAAAMPLADRLMAAHRRPESMEACTRVPGSGRARRNAVPSNGLVPGGQ